VIRRAAAVSRSIAASLLVLTLAVASCSDQPEVVGPLDGKGEDVPRTSSRLGAIPSSNVGEVVRLSQAATLVTFSEFSVGTSITDQYKDVGIIFGGSSPFISPDEANPTSPVLSGTPLFQGAITGTFVIPGTTTPTTVESFSFDAGYFDAVGTTELRWFDLNGALIGSQTNTTLGIQTLTATAPGIASWSMQIISSELAGYAIDNVQFVPVDPDCPDFPWFRGKSLDRLHDLWEKSNPVSGPGDNTSQTFEHGGWVVPEGDSYRIEEWTNLVNACRVRPGPGQDVPPAGAATQVHTHPLAPNTPSNPYPGPICHVAQGDGLVHYPGASKADKGLTKRWSEDPNNPISETFIIDQNGVIQVNADGSEVPFSGCING